MDQNAMMMMLQYLSGAGQDIASGNPISTNVNQYTQQIAQTQMLKSMLAGGGKITMDNQNVNIKAPTSALNMSPNAQDPVMQDKTGIKAGTKTPSTATPKTSGVGQIDPQMLLLAGLLNPSASPLDAGAIPAGLTPDNLFKALQFKLAGEELSQKKITDLVDTMYKGALIDESRARTELGQSAELRKWQELFRTSPLEVPGLGQVDLDTWKSLDTKTKAYSYYAFNAQQRGEEVLGYNEWARQTDDPTAYELYQLAMDDPQFNEWLTRYRESGATRLDLGEYKARRRAAADVESQAFFTSPKGLAKAVDDYIESEDVQDRLFRIEDPNVRRRTVVAEKEKFVRDKIQSSGGKILDEWVDQEARTFNWKVKWPDGREETVTYAP